MKFRCLTHLAIVLAAMSLACGGDDGPSGPSGPGGGTPASPMAAGFAAVASAHAAVIESNAATFASVETFGPFVIQSFLSPPPRTQISSPEPDAGQSSCLPVSVQDVVFAFDTGQGQYVPTMVSGAPSGGARYILYEVDGSGVPVVPLVEAGFFDIDCDAMADTISTCVENTSGVTIMETELYVTFVSVSRPEYIITTSPGTLRSPDGTFALDITFSAQAEEFLYEMGTRLTIVGGLESIDPSTLGFQARAGLDDPTLTNGLPSPPYSLFVVGGSQAASGQLPAWSASTAMSVAADNTLRNIQQGLRAPLEFQTAGTSNTGVLACFSGDYRMPTVEDAASDGGCATGVIETQIPLSANDLASIQEGSATLTDMLEKLSNMLAVALPLIL